MGVALKVLVTGATGFAGGHVVSHILSMTDWRVVALDTSLVRLAKLNESDRVTAVQYDLRDELREDAFTDVDAVVHLAASSDVPAFLRNPAYCARNNVDGTLNLLEWARHRRLKTFIQVSTNEVYGPSRHPAEASKEWDPLVPSTPYSASKACQEVLAIGWRRTYGVPVVIVNTMHLFGEEQPRRRFVPTAITKLLDGDPVPIYLHPQFGAPVRNWTYVGDFARAIVRLLERGISDDVRDDRWNVAGRELSCHEVAKMIAAQLYLPLEVRWLGDAERPGYDPRYALDTTKMHDELMKMMHYGTDEGLRRTINWIKEGRSGEA